MDTLVVCGHPISQNDVAMPSGAVNVDTIIRSRSADTQRAGGVKEHLHPVFVVQHMAFQVLLCFHSKQTHSPAQASQGQRCNVRLVHTLVDIGALHYLACLYISAHTIRIHFPANILLRHHDIEPTIFYIGQHMH